MVEILRRIYAVIRSFGIDPFKMVRGLQALPLYLRDLAEFKRQQASSRDHFSVGLPYPCLHDRFSEGGTASGHYFHQDLLVARRIFRNAPETHVDVGSRIDGFVGHVASFRSIVVLDVRPMKGGVRNIAFAESDLTRDIPASMAECCDSLSCLHALEHFGLGRYGDRLDFEGHKVGIDNLHKLLKVGGKFYLSVPIGDQRIEFNAHRVFSVAYLLELLGDRFALDSFSFVDDKGDLFENVELTPEKATSNFGCSYGCGIFEMTKMK